LVSIKELYYDAQPTKSQDNHQELHIMFQVNGIGTLYSVKLFHFIVYLIDEVIQPNLTGSNGVWPELHTEELS